MHPENPLAISAHRGPHCWTSGQVSGAWAAAPSRLTRSDNPTGFRVFSRFHSAAATPSTRRAPGRAASGFGAIRAGAWGRASPTVSTLFVLSTGVSDGSPTLTSPPCRPTRVGPTNNGCLQLTGPAANVVGKAQRWRAGPAAEARRYMARHPRVLQVCIAHPRAATSAG